MSYQITDCRAVQSSQLCSAMNAAFSDYVVPLSLTEDKFRDFQKQRGYSAEHSFVALAGNEIAAFWFSSAPLSSYEHHAYTLSVGTVPAHRRKGLSRQLLHKVIGRQNPNGGRGLQLEVITTNEKAVTAYQEFGFQVRRTLRVCRIAGKRPGFGGEPEFTPEKITLDQLPADEGAFFDTEPTPQNSRAALRGLLETSHVLGVFVNERLIGWGASYADGSVAQIAVHREFRRRGTGQALLDGLRSATGAGQLTFVNVDTAAEGVNAFLDRAGAEDRVHQLEMRLTF